jgi:hypothetical protein
VNETPPSFPLLASVKKQFRYVACFWRFLNVLLTANAVSAATHYVSLDSPNPQPPYTNWATAATNIQQAIDAAASGDEIIVTNGIYATGGRTVGTNLLVNRVAVDKSLTLRSVNGPEVTIILGAKAPGGGNGDGAIRCVYLADSAKLNGFTLTNGATWGNLGDYETNMREGSGGGVWCASTNATLTNCVLAGNSAAVRGGGAYHGTLHHCMLTENSAGCTGGGISDGLLHNCTLMDNLAWAGGGAHTSTLNNCTLTRNVAQDGGGVYYSTLYNCMLADNAGYGAAGGTLYNCTLTGNLGYGAYGGKLYNCILTGNLGYGAYGGKLYNCIVYFNQGPEGKNYSDQTIFEYSCTTPLPPGPGNIATDPQLASLFHLSSTSPCLRAGGSVYAIGVDIDGEPWADPPAMGADQPGTTTGPLRLWIDASNDIVAPGYPISFTASNTGPILASVWDFGGGIKLTNQPIVSHAWNTTGVYSVRLTGYNDSNPGGVTATVQITVSEAVAYADAASTNPVFPYASWATAARTLQEAIEAAPAGGGLVLVTNGVYSRGIAKVQGINRVALIDRVMVRSLNGPEVTIIEGEANGVRCAFVGNGSVLSGFTLTKGTGGHPVYPMGGGVFCESEGVVTNCVIVGNLSQYDSGGGAYGGTLYSCILRVHAKTTSD